MTFRRTGLFNTEDEGNKILRNAGVFIQHPRGRGSSETAMRNWNIAELFVNSRTKNCVPLTDILTNKDTKILRNTGVFIQHPRGRGSSETAMRNSNIAELFENSRTKNCVPLTDILTNKDTKIWVLFWMRPRICNWVNARCTDLLSVNHTPLVCCRTKNSVRRFPARDNRRNNRLYSNYQCVGGNIIAGNILFIGMQSCYSRQTEINTENIKTNKQSAAIVFRAKLYINRRFSVVRLLSALY